MDQNKIKDPEGFKNIKNTVDQNPAIENNGQESLTRLKDIRNPEITKENLVKDAENAIPPTAWENQQKAYDDAWENNKNQQLGEEV
ncbi:hypothetical protein [Chryseobacterium sp. VAUSW3]|uniref:hypothetical protein n=1 Tax=Chryseobacterium sp. VAUSW3 TaxID=2010998 RepID=UPI000B4C978B|nr:hypothetical protein [Chryseobacterium sp. VAUSW3]OWR14268.1 hypothetical protein CDW55_08060 [Chryseobacterium sp. VAUSW3]